MKELLIDLLGWAVLFALFAGLFYVAGGIDRALTPATTDVSVWTDRPGDLRTFRNACRVRQGRFRIVEQDGGWRLDCWSTGKKQLRKGE